MALTVGAPVKVRPEPEAVSPVTPPRFVPLRVMVTVVPGRPEDGLMPVRVTEPMVKVTEVGAGPFAPVTLMACDPFAPMPMFMV